MCVPEGTSIVDYIKNYFVEDAATDALLTNEQVRVLYYDSQGRGSDNKGVFLKYKEFDIYVHESVLHTASDDRLKGRDVLIAERLKFLLLNKFHICRLHFQYVDEYDLWTKTVGYKRYHLVLFYRISV